MADLYAKYASIIPDISIDKPLDYGLTADQAASAKRGMRVEIAVRGRPCKGYIYEIKEDTVYPKIQGVRQLISDTEIITSDLFELAIWMAKYYCVSLREAIQICLPAAVRKGAKHKQQLFVMRGKTKEMLIEHCQRIRNKHSGQADVLDVMIKVNKGILLSELLELTKGSRSPVDTLVKQGFLLTDIVRVDRSPLTNEEYFPTKPKNVNPEQSAALKNILLSLEGNFFQTHLLYGITGSGKTEVYLQAIEKALQYGKGTIMLIPEISLTPQTIERFRGRFNESIAILHHRLSVGERFDEWHKIHRGEAKIVIGARSAIFSPVKNLGLIIVDEEHEMSYKQNEIAPCYHARDVAVMRGKLNNASVILGSATPSLESYYNALQGKYTLNTLMNRAEAQSLPKFTIVDMKEEYLKAKSMTSFSDLLLKGICLRRDKGEQTILLLNRRGYHTTMTCQSCALAVRCTHCDVALTFHLGDNHLACHLCGHFLAPPPRQCPKCQCGNTMKYKGVGTEHVERALHAILKEIRTIRVDADTTKHKGSHQKLLRDFACGKADVLIGTQMIAKGLHFPQVTLVGILNSDMTLNIPDFRASETAFQLITQVAGRAGRGAVEGEVIVQTCLPDNSTITFAAAQDFQKFYEEEIAVRKLFSYPPFASLAKLTFSGEDKGKTHQVAEQFREELLRLLPKEFELHSVVASGHAKIKDKFRFQVLIRGPGIYPISQSLIALKASSTWPKSVHILIDINPSSTFF